MMQRHLVGEGELGHAVALGVGVRADRAGHHREVLGGDHDGPAVDAARAHHDGVGRGLLAAHQGAQLEERARVEEVVDAGAGVELAEAAVLGEPFLAAHGARGGPPLLEVGDGAVPALRPVELELGHRHRPVKLAGRRSM